MQETKTVFTQDFYKKYLSAINNIHFTSREIDVIACLLNGRKTSKTAFFLSIDPRTVETHIRNIMSKLECNTREAIIDFIEATDRLTFLRRYYALLRINVLFEKSLKDISKTNQNTPLRCFFIEGTAKDPLIEHLKSHLRLAGISISKAAREKAENHIIFVLSAVLAGKDALLLQQKLQYPNKTLFILQTGKNYQEIPKELINSHVIDFAKQENYYFAVFAILKKLFPNLNWEKIIADFKDKYEKIPTAPKSIDTSSKDKDLDNHFLYSIQRKSTLIILAILGFLGSGFVAFYWIYDNEGHYFRSDLIVPTESGLLNRPELLTQIDEKFKKQGGIQAAALVGPGGAGKTTLARQYARTQKTNSVWEINAETRESLNTSFENLAQILAKTEEEQRFLKGIQEIKNFTEKEEKIIQFVKDRLRFQKNWFLIFDNTETFTDIQKHFPHDPQTWGQGKVILTTRNGNIVHNKHVNHTIFIGELTPQQKLTFFQKIIINGNAYFLTKDQIIEAQRFLEKIPPFPLDVSMAAHYLKSTNISYEYYLNKLYEYNEDFLSIQELLLKEMGDYTKTRYSIISISLQKLIDSHQDFHDLLLFISLLDSQNIPKDLLGNSKKDDVVNNFILNLKKYSLITNEFSLSSFPHAAFSVHRSTQAISLSYLTKKLGLGKDKTLITTISEKLENYIDEVIKKEDLNKMKSVITHCIAFLKNKHLLTPDIEGTIKGELGIIHYFQGDNIKAKIYLEESLSKLNQLDEKNFIRRALFLGYLGNVVRDLGNDNKGKRLLQQSISMYEKYAHKDPLRHAYFLVYLGFIERVLGNYGAAKALFEKGLVIHHKHFPENENYAMWATGQLGIIERELGNYEIAKNILEKSLTIFKRDRPSDHFDIAWALEHLGVVYTQLGNYEKAKETLEECLKVHTSSLPDQIGPSWLLAHFDSSFISGNSKNVTTLFDQLLKTYEVHFHDNYIYVAWPMRHLGILYMKVGDYEKAKVLLKQGLAIYQKNYGASHIATAQVLSELAQVYLLEGNMKIAENFATKALRVLQQSDHPDTYLCLESLAELYLKKSKIAESKKNINQAKNFEKQAVNCLKQALETVQKKFPKDSPHIIRIRSKLTPLQ